MAELLPSSLPSVIDSPVPGKVSPSHSDLPSIRESTAVSLAVGAGTAGVAAWTHTSPELLIGLSSVAASGSYLVTRVAHALKYRQHSRRIADPRELVERSIIRHWMIMMLALLAEGSSFWRDVKSGQVAVWRKELAAFAERAQ